MEESYASNTIDDHCELDDASSKSNPFEFDTRLLTNPSLLLDERCFVDFKGRENLILKDRLLANRLKMHGRTTFIAHARWMLDHHQLSNITSFRLCASPPLEGFTKILMTECMQMAARKHVEKMELDFSDPDHHTEYPAGCTAYAMLPPEVYRHCKESLHTLSLSGCDLNPWMLVGLRALRVLSIERVQLTPDMVELVFANCHNLEDLTLRNLGLLSHVNLIDLRGNFKRLTIDDCVPMITGIKLVAPKIKYFKYFGVVTSIEIDDRNSLEEAHVDFGRQFVIYEHATLLSQILSSLQSASLLTLCGYFTRFLTFRNMNEPQLSEPIILLEHLRLINTTLGTDELMGFVFLLKSYPMMEALTIELGNQSCVTPLLLRDEEDRNSIINAHSFLESQLSMPITCLERFLKKLEIKNFTGQENEMLVIEFLLRKAAVLEDLFVSITSGIEMDLNRFSIFLQELSIASPTIMIDGNKYAN